MELLVSKKNGRKTFHFLWQRGEDFDTVLKQFKLNMIDTADISSLLIKEMNGVLYQTNERINFVDMLSYLAYVFSDKRLCDLLDDDLNLLFISQTALSDSEQKTLFKGNLAFEYSLKNVYAYVLKKKTPVSHETEESDKKDEAVDRAKDDIYSLQALVSDLTDSNEALKNIAFHKIESITENKIEQKQSTDVKLNSYLENNFSTYLNTTNQRLNLIYKFITNSQTPFVINLTQNSHENLLKLIRAIANYGDQDEN